MGEADNGEEPVGRERGVSPAHTCKGWYAQKGGRRRSDSRHVLFGDEYLKKMDEILCGIEQPDDWASLESFAAHGTRSLEHVREDCGLGGEQAAIHAERGITSDENDVAIVEPDVSVGLEVV